MIALALRYWWVAVIAVLLALLGTQTLRLAAAQEAMSEHLADDAFAKAAEQSAARAKEQADQASFDAEAQRVRDEREEHEAAISDLAATGDRLRDELAEFKRRARAAAACPAERGARVASADPLDLLADVYARADREAAELGRYADELRRAGAACERASDAVSISATPNS